MLRMRTFRLDQPNYVIFNITWYDLMGGGAMGGVGALVGMSLFGGGDNPALILIFFSLGFLLYWAGMRFYQRVFPYDSGRLVLDWYLSQQSFYEHRPDEVVVPLFAKGEKALR